MADEPKDDSKKTPPVPPEQTEEDKVRELYQAYLMGGQEGIKRVLERRDAERLRHQHPSQESS